MDEARQVVQRSIDSCLRSGDAGDRMRLKTRVRDDLSKFLLHRTGRKPMILPVSMNV